MQSAPVFAAALDSRALRALGSAPGVATSAVNLDSMSDCGMDLDAPDPMALTGMCLDHVLQDYDLDDVPAPEITPDLDSQNATYTVNEKSRLSDFGVASLEMQTPSGLKGASIPPPNEESRADSGMPAAPKRFKPASFGKHFHGNWHSPTTPMGASECARDGCSEITSVKYCSQYCMRVTEEDPTIPPSSGLERGLSFVPSGTSSDAPVPSMDLEPSVLAIRFKEHDPVPGFIECTYEMMVPRGPSNISLELRSRILREFSFQELSDLMHPFMGVPEFSEAYLLESLVDSYLTHKHVIMSRKAQAVSARFLEGAKASKGGLGYKTEASIGYLDAGDTYTMECQQCHFLNPSKTRKELKASTRCLVAKGRSNEAWGQEIEADLNPSGYASSAAASFLPEAFSAPKKCMNCGCEDLADPVLTSAPPTFVVGEGLSWVMDFTPHEDACGSNVTVGSFQWKIEGPDGTIMPYSDAIRKANSINLSELAIQFGQCASGPLHVSDVLPEGLHVSKSFSQLAEIRGSKCQDGESPPDNAVDPDEPPTMGFHPSVHACSSVNPAQATSKEERYDILPDSVKDKITVELRDLQALRDGAHEGSVHLKTTGASQTSEASFLKGVSNEELFLVLVDKASKIMSLDIDSYNTTDLAGVFQKVLSDSKQRHATSQATSLALQRKVDPPVASIVASAWPESFKDAYCKGLLVPFGSISSGPKDPMSDAIKQKYIELKSYLKWMVTEIPAKFWSDFPGLACTADPIPPLDSEERTSVGLQMLIKEVNNNWAAEKQYAGVWNKAPGQVADPTPVSRSQPPSIHNSIKTAGARPLRAGEGQPPPQSRTNRPGPPKEDACGSSDGVQSKYLKPEQVTLVQSLEPFTWATGKLAKGAMGQYARASYTPEDLLDQRSKGLRPWLEDMVTVHEAFFRESPLEYNPTAISDVYFWRRETHSVDFPTLFHQFAMSGKLSFKDLMLLWDSLPFEIAPHRRMDKTIRGTQRKANYALAKELHWQEIVDACGSSVKNMTWEERRDSLRFITRFVAARSLTPAVAPSIWESFPIMAVQDTKEQHELRVLHDHLMYPDWNAAKEVLSNMGHRDLALELNGIIDNTVSAQHHWICNRKKEWVSFVSQHKELYKVYRALWKSQPPHKQAEYTSHADIWEVGSTFLLNVVWEASFELTVTKWPKFTQPFYEMVAQGLKGDACGSSLKYVTAIQIKEGSKLEAVFVEMQRWEDEMNMELLMGAPLNGWNQSIDTQGDPCVMINHFNVSSTTSPDWRKKDKHGCRKYFEDEEWGLKGMITLEDSKWQDPNYRTAKQAPAFHAEAACGLALSSLSPWTVEDTPSGRTVYQCKACTGQWAPGQGGSRQITLFGKVEPDSFVRAVKSNVLNLQVETFPSSKSYYSAMPAAPTVTKDRISGLTLPSGLNNKATYTPYQLIPMEDGSKALVIQLEMDEPPGKPYNQYIQSKVKFQRRFKGSEPLRDVPLDSRLKVSKRIKLTGEPCKAMWQLLLKHPEGEVLKRLEDIARKAIHKASAHGRH